MTFAQRLPLSADRFWLTGSWEGIIRRLSIITAGIAALSGCSPHQSGESFELWGIVIVISLIGLAFWINSERRN